MSVVVPIGQRSRRLPQAGRIRIGEKGGTQGRRAIDTFRFTSQDRSLLEPIAELYGGDIKPWNEAKSGDKFELRTAASKINVVLPPDPLTEAYELWSGKGLDRRCDGTTCANRVKGPEGNEHVDVPCLCEQRGVLECKYKLRLSVILPEVESLGVWRLDTSSDHARMEMPSVVETIESLQGRGMARAVLRLEQRTLPGQRFNVPVLDPGVGIEALGAGAARLALTGSHDRDGAAHPAAAAALGRGGEERAVESTPPGSAAPSPAFSMGAEDDVVDAEVIEDVDPTIARAWLDNLPAKDKNAALRRAREVADDMNEPAPTTAAAISPAVLNVLAEEMMG